MNTSVPVEGVGHLSVQFFRSRELGEGMIRVTSRGKKPERIVRVAIYRTFDLSTINEDFEPDQFARLDNYWFCERRSSLPTLITEDMLKMLRVKIMEI